MKQRVKYTIHEIGVDFGDAPFGTALKTKDYVDVGIPVIQGRNIKNNKFEWNSKLYVTEEKFNSLKRSHCREGDLVFPKIGTIGITAIMPKVEGHTIFLLSTNMMKMSVNCTIADIKYVYYYFCQSHIRDHIRATAGGSSQPIFNFTTLKNFEIELPPLPTQRKIAAILSAYDRLIENNTRRIEILEEMARSIYREWFVKFRFPGHEQVQMVDSELGLIPEGWEVVCLGKLASFQTGKLNSNAAKPNGVYPFFTCSQEIFRTDTYSFDTECVLLAGNNANGVFHIKYFKGKFDAYQRTYVIRSLNQHQVTNYYLYFAIKAQLEHLKSISTGSATKFLTLTILNNLNIIVSLPDIQDKFAKFIFVVFSEIELLQAKNANLRKTRDLLLPRLISGEIDVENLDINTGPIAA
jgi:type I restriction enzyme S subunit